MVYITNETQEGSAPGFVALIDAGMLKHLHEHAAHLLAENGFCVFSVEVTAAQDFLRPVGVLSQRRISTVPKQKVSKYRIRLKK